MDDEAIMRVSRGEQETILRWDEEERLLHVWTASRKVARRLERKGYRLTRTRPGSGMQATVSLKAIIFRPLAEDGFNPKKHPLRGATARRKPVASPELTRGGQSDDTTPETGTPVYPPEDERRKTREKWGSAMSWVEGDVLLVAVVLVA